MNLNFNFNGLTRLKDWWKIIKDNLLSIQQFVNKEVHDRKAADASLAADIASEAETRLNMDNALNEKIDGEISERGIEYAALQSDMANEINERKSADLDLQSQISNIVIQNRDEQIKQILGEMLLSCDVKGEGDSCNINVDVSESGTPFFSLNTYPKNQFFINSNSAGLETENVIVEDSYPKGAEPGDNGMYILHYAIYFKWNYINNTVSFSWTHDLNFHDYMEEDTWYHTVCIIEQRYGRVGIGQWSSEHTVQDNPNMSIRVTGKIGTVDNLVTNTKYSVIEAVNENAKKIEILNNIPVISVDTSLSALSVNPVQNKAVTAKLSELETAIDDMETTLGILASELDEVNGG